MRVRAETEPGGERRSALVVDGMARTSRRAWVMRRAPRLSATLVAAVARSRGRRGAGRDVVGGDRGQGRVVHAK